MTHWMVETSELSSFSMLGRTTAMAVKSLATTNTAMPRATRAVTVPGARPLLADPASICRATLPDAVAVARLQDAIDEAVSHRLVRVHEAVAVHVVVDAFGALAGVAGVELVEAPAQGQRLARVDLDVGRLPLESAGGLVDEDARVGQREAVAGRPAGQDQRAHRHGDSDPGRPHARGDELHRVVDAQPGVDVTARAIDVERDVGLGVGRLEVQQLGDDEVGDLVVDGRAEEDHALGEQARVDVERALAASVALDDHGDERHGPGSLPSREPLAQLLGCTSP